MSLSRRPPASLSQISSFIVVDNVANRFPSPQIRSVIESENLVQSQ